MSAVPIRELRNHTAQVVDRVRDGEEVVLTSNGNPIATITPIRAKKVWMSRSELLQIPQSDPALRGYLMSLAEQDTTDDLGPIR
jgi:prevent-host-death family protein